MTSINVVLIRHAEKPDGRRHETGIDGYGRDDPHSLSRRGWQRAKELPVFFTVVGTTSPLLPIPDRIFASAFRPGGGHSRRPEQTVQPLSETLHCPVDLRWSLHQERELGAVLASLEGTSLVCWQHQGLAALAKAIVAPQSLPALQEWPADCYDGIWWLHRDSPGEWWRMASYRMIGIEGFLAIVR
ncbi:hypothetical protein LU298_14190 [Komagataeibacter intermedius]|uniref:Phosphoglycerate mutase n=2 Tax=Komagataeibacter intermedius TaxID=66229 RepID=A0A0N1F9S4_9PROT|nr:MULTISPECIES: hypothetical protein [Komagataeibacter]AHI27413.1 hypothetical protein H845_3512 [Komagataeibacter xylinus E25]KPH85650.1 hypothetical protein GLUCOINTEAF2_0203277 [Komagataeibacter intermedius AF2]MCF3637638.1 hypothetical protein [Komagataeibacter intermedius]GAN87319.1 hypothetical protein Gain_0059_012 [Komagataeibacter intermedius TF2]GBQ55965.1 hypothetical protein AA16373_0603 [Komagataeibacter swingsii DSM 16373]